MSKKFEQVAIVVSIIRYVVTRLIHSILLFASLGFSQHAFAQTGFWDVALSPGSGTAGTDGTLYVTFSGSVKAVDADDAVSMVRIYEGSTMMREATYNVAYNKFDVPINTTRYFAMGMPLAAGTHQLFAEASTINGGFTSQVLTVNVQPSSAGPSAPPVPTGLTASGGIGSINVQWNYASNATSYALQKTVTSTVPLVSNLTTNSYVDTGVVQGAGYYYNVKACNSIGCSSWSATAYATPNATAPVPAPSPGPGAAVPAANMSAVLAAIDMLLNDIDESASTPTVPTPQPGGNSPGGSGGIVEVYEYNALGRLIKASRDGALKSHYEYDNAGNRKQVND